MRRSLFLATLIALASSAAAQAPDNAEVRAAAQAFDDAQFHRDRAALDAMIAPDFLFIRGSGRVGDKRDFIDGFTAPGATFDPFVITDRLLLRIAPDVASVGGEGRISGIEDGTRFAEHFRFTDTFVKRDGKWLAVLTQVTGLAK